MDESGGVNSSGGNGDDGYTLVADGSGPPPNWVVEERQDGGNYAEDDSGPLAGTFGTSQDFSAEDSIIFPTLDPELHVLARPQQGAEGRCWGGGASARAAAAATVAAALNGSLRRCRGGGVSASAAAAAPAAAALALNGSRGRCRDGGASASAAAAATAAAAAFNGIRGRGRGGGDTAKAAVAAAGAGTVGGDRRSGCGDFGDGQVDTDSRRAHRRWNHSRWGVWSGKGGGDIYEGAAGPPGGAVVFATTATAAAVPCDTDGHEIEIEILAVGSIKDVYASCGGGGYRADSRPAGRSLL